MDSKCLLESDMDKVKPVSSVDHWWMKYFGQLEATCPKSAHNVLGLKGLKIFMTFEEEIKISRQRCCSQACDVCHPTASAMSAACF
jgi:hypothetical protein